jgi:uncharacterized lipoprotein YmbA
MNGKFRNMLVLPAALPVVLLLSACATVSRSSDFYTLSSQAAPGGMQASVLTGCRDAVIGIGPVVWPSYLNRPQIVTRLSPNRISFDEFHRWAGPLEEEFERVLIDDLSKRLQTDYIVKYPGKLAYKPQHRVPIKVIQFDGRPGDAVTLKAAWSVVEPGSGKDSSLHNTDVRVPAAGEGYEAMVAAASEAVAELSRQIAAELSIRCGISHGK